MTPIFLISLGINKLLSNKYMHGSPFWVYGCVVFFHARMAHPFQVFGKDPPHYISVFMDRLHYLPTVRAGRNMFEESYEEHYSGGGEAEYEFLRILWWERGISKLDLMY